MFGFYVNLSDYSTLFQGTGSPPGFTSQDSTADALQARLNAAKFVTSRLVLALHLSMAIQWAVCGPFTPAHWLWFHIGDGQTLVTKVLHFLRMIPTSFQRTVQIEHSLPMLQSLLGVSEALPLVLDEAQVLCISATYAHPYDAVRPFVNCS